MSFRSKFIFSVLGIAEIKKNRSDFNHSFFAIAQATVFNFDIISYHWLTI